MNLSYLRLSAVASAIGLLALLLSGCVVPDGRYGYGERDGFGPGYYEPYGTYYGGWGPGYFVAPYRGREHHFDRDDEHRFEHEGEHRPDHGGEHGPGREAGHPPSQAFRAPPAGQPMPSIPSRSGGPRSR